MQNAAICCPPEVSGSDCVVFVVDGYGDPVVDSTASYI